MQATKEVIFISIKIGVPRGLYYYKHFPFTEAFLTELGAEVVPSSETTKDILDKGVKYCIDDACLPVKVYHGHAHKLRNTSDYILVPRLTSVSQNEYICPKFGGLPEMVKFSVPDLPQLLDIEIDLSRSGKHLKKSLYKLGHQLNIKNPLKIKRAVDKALTAHQGFKQSLLNGNIPNRVFRGEPPQESNKKYTVGVIGHPYLIYDDFVNMKLLSKLNDWNIKYVTAEMIDPHIINERCMELSKRMFWSSAKSIIGSALYMMDNSQIDGLLIVTAFGCGIDSIAVEYVENALRRYYKKPFIVLTTDEHTGDAGYNTRLEAFKSLLDWRSENEANVPAHGRSVYSR